MRKSPIHVYFVENNPYDRATIDAFFSFDPKSYFYYTLEPPDEELRPYGLIDIARVLKEKKKTKRDIIILLDLALTKKCEDILSTYEFRKVLDYTKIKKIVSQVSIIDKKDLDGVIAFTIELSLYLFNRNNDTRRYFFINLKKNPSIDIIKKKAHLNKYLQEILKCEYEDTDTNIIRLANDFFSKYWKGSEKDVILFSQVPSLFRILALIAAFPETCFAVVSHYVDENIVLPILEIIGCMCPSPKPQDKISVYQNLIFNKASLIDFESDVSFPEMLRSSYYIWQKLHDPRFFLAPFSQLKIKCSDSQYRFFKDVVAEWENFNIKKQDIYPNCVVFWDESRLLVGAKHSWDLQEGLTTAGWAAIFRRWAQALIGIKIADIQDIKSNKDKDYFLLTKYLETEPEGNTFGELIEKLFPKNTGKVNKYFILSGSEKAFNAAKQNYPNSALWYKVPNFNDNIWKKGKLLFNIIQDIPLYKDPSGKYQVSRCRNEDLIQTIKGPEPLYFSDLLQRKFRSKLVRPIVDKIFCDKNPPNEWNIFFDSISDILLKYIKKVPIDEILINFNYKKSEKNFLS